MAASKYAPDLVDTTEVAILVQKLKDNCNESINLGHTVTITLERVCDWYGKGKCIQMEALA
ncbi:MULTISPECIES: hypothetical protein [Bacillus]|uniref:hypothetical protein n=1 Tax=Bacillus TaxID=1386 RepID=UPI000994E47A|nr:MULTISPECIES: hypothetical protein [Bacillus cereus group]OOR31899.1 hypothetical protein BW894_25500 [Bacillus mycoides]